MNHAIPLFLSQDKRVMLARAGATFPGEKLNEVIARTLADIPKDRNRAINPTFKTSS